VIMESLTSTDDRPRFTDDRTYHGQHATLHNNKFKAKYHCITSARKYQQFRI